MSFVAVPRQNFETFQADGPWQSGARGWSTAPVPGWGMNPNQVLPRRQSTAGCGCAVGDDTAVPAPAPAKLPLWPLFALTGVLAISMYGTYRMAKYFDAH